MSFFLHVLEGIQWQRFLLDPWPSWSNRPGPERRAGADPLRPSSPRTVSGSGSFDVSGPRDPPTDELGPPPGGGPPSLSRPIHLPIDFSFKREVLRVRTGSNGGKDHHRLEEQHGDARQLADVSRHSSTKAHVLECERRDEA